MSSRRVPIWWIVLVAILASIAGGYWLTLDSLRYGNASALHRAVMKNDHERVKRLIARGADVNARMKASLSPYTWDATPLHVAVRRSSVEIVEELIRAGADKDAVDELGFTPLHGALLDGADAAAQVLIRARAKLRSDTSEGQNNYAMKGGQPIQTAFEHASIITVRMMLDAGADARLDLGDDAMAHVNDPDRLPKLQLLFELGFSVEGSSTRGRPLHLAAQSNNVDAIAFLLDHGADIEAKGGRYAGTPLLAAEFAGSNDAIKLLIERGANPKARTDDIGSPIYAAAFSGKRETVRLLLSMNLGIDLQAGRASDNATPLHFAYRHNDEVMADLLIKSGALPTARTADGRLPTEFRR